MTPLDLHMDKAQGVIGQFLEWTIRTPWRVIVGLGLLIPMSSTGFSPGYYLLRDVLALITTVILMAISTGNASAETFRFPAAARAAYGVPQVDIAMSVYMHPDCAGRWFVEYPPGFAFRRGGPNGGNLYGNPGRGSYDVAIKTDACPSWDSDYVEPARTTWHKVVVY